MKELVCVAPDGSLEVWEQDLDITDGHSIFYGMDPLDFHTVDFGSPEFWGREVLGEL